MAIGVRSLADSNILFGADGLMIFFSETGSFEGRILLEVGESRCQTVLIGWLLLVLL